MFLPVSIVLAIPDKKLKTKVDSETTCLGLLIIVLIVPMLWCNQKGLSPIPFSKAFENLPQNASLKKCFGLDHVRNVIQMALKGQTTQTNEYENYYSQRPCLTFSKKKRQYKVSNLCNRQVDRWQLDSKTEGSLRCHLAKATWQIHCYYNYK